MSLAIVTSVDDFFYTEIEKISKRHGLQLSPLVLRYLSGLLAKFSTASELKLTHPTEHKDMTPTEFWLEIQKLPYSQQLQALQFLGDYSLFTTGFFSEYTKGSLLDRDYFQAIGGKAYYRAGEIKENIAAEKSINVYFSLAESFRRFSEIFSEIYDQTLLHSSDGAIKLFERWQQNGSDHLTRMLFENGFHIGKKPTAE
ncbi:MAG: hypothetical protein R3A80_00980 [Bdellovibrionota bacterium]